MAPCPQRPRSIARTGGAIVATAPTPFTDILVPLDGSEAAERALDQALDLAGRTGVPVRALRRTGSDDDEATEYLAAVADRCSSTLALATETVAGESLPAAILDALGPGTLVCMSSRGRGGVVRAVMGSSAEALLRVLDRPALVVGPNLVAGHALAGRIVVCIDGSDESLRTVGPAQAWGAAFGLPLWLIEVVGPGSLLEGPGHDDIVESARVAALAAELTGVESWDVLPDRDPARALVTLAASTLEPTACLVMATHGRTGWDRLRLGSVTTAAVRTATVPVLVVPAAPAGGLTSG
jgi:nucleotide-binding universal stress UspA family protein